MRFKIIFLTFLGGINKDSGYYLFSPHANLHLQASNLAFTHTESFFNKIREQIGDEEFSNFLQLKLTSAQIENLSGTCGGSSYLKNSKINRCRIIFVFLWFIISFP